MNKRSNISQIFACLALLTLYVLVRLPLINSPITYSEAVESNQSYSLIKTGRDTNSVSWPLIFKGENNLPSAAAVYFRIPFIWLLGLNNPAVRLPGVFVGAVFTLVFGVWLSIFIKRKKIIWLTIFTAAVFPWFITTQVFHLGQTITLCLAFGAGLSLARGNGLRRLFITLGAIVLAIYSSITVVFIIAFLVLATGRRKYRRVLITALILTVVGLFLNQDFRQYTLGHSIVTDFFPQSYSWKLERRLAFDKVGGSPLSVGGRNYNRLIHNKVAYTVNSFLTAAVTPFDFERLASPFQTETILGSVLSGYKSLPKLLFIEVPLILVGLAVISKRKPYLMLLMIVGALSLMVFYLDWESLPYLAVFLVVAEAFGILAIFSIQNRVIRNPLLVGIAVIYLVGYLSFLDIAGWHRQAWVDEKDFRQWQIWDLLQNIAGRYDQITVTDRLGEPVNYFLYYTKYSPGQYQSQRVLGGLTNQNVRQISLVGSYHFRTFAYLESDRKPGQFWVGLAGEFTGRLSPYQNVVTISDGEILAKSGE